MKWDTSLVDLVGIIVETKEKKFENFSYGRLKILEAAAGMMLLIILKKILIKSMLKTEILKRGKNGKEKT